MAKKDHNSVTPQEELLKDLATKINNGNMAVVVGPELSIVRDQDKKVNLYDFLIPDLKERVKNVQGQYEKWDFNNQNWDYRELAVFREKYNKKEIAIRIKNLRNDKGYLQFLDKLAEMNFDTYVSVTPDGWLTNALKRKKGKENVYEFSYKLKANEAPSYFNIEGEHNDDEDFDKKVVVLNLFGSVNETANVTDYAGSNIEIMERLYSFEKSSSEHLDLRRIIERIKAKSALLFVGCDFSEGLFCLLCRVLNFADFRDEGFTNFEISIAHQNLASKPKLSATLEKLKAKVYVDNEYFNNSLVFVQRLHSFWAKENIIRKGKRHEIFLSYASKDFDTIQQIHSYLQEDQGFHDVWFDEKKIDPGDNYVHEISEGIRDCKLFLMFLSEHTTAKAPDAYVKREWTTALHESGNGKLKIMIFSIDDTPFDSLKQSLPDGFETMSIQKLSLKDEKASLEDFYDRIMQKLSEISDE